MSGRLCVTCTFIPTYVIKDFGWLCQLNCVCHPQKKESCLVLTKLCTKARPARRCTDLMWAELIYWMNKCTASAATHKTRNWWEQADSHLHNVISILIPVVGLELLPLGLLIDIIISLGIKCELRVGDGCTRLLKAPTFVVPHSQWCFFSGLTLLICTVRYITLIYDAHILPNG